MKYEPFIINPSASGYSLGDAVTERITNALAVHDTLIYHSIDAQNKLTIETEQLQQMLMLSNSLLTEIKMLHDVIMKSFLSDEELP